MDVGILQCPESGLPLRQLSRSEAEQIAGPLLPRKGAAFETSEDVLLRIDNKVAYLVVEGVPILLAPEGQGPSQRNVDLGDPRWAEAYAEMDFYGKSALARLEVIDARVSELQDLRNTMAPSLLHVDAAYDAASQWDALRHLGELSGRTTLQLGGSGLAAMKTLLAGARESWLITPMHNEARYALELARRLHVADRFGAVVGVAEQLPFVAGRFDAAYSGGCLHHMSTEFAGSEISRVLAPGGRFAAVEPWQTPLHRWGTRVIGKREPNAYCRPLTPGRLAPIRDEFESVEIRHHGPLLRYAALAWLKVSKRAITPKTGLRLTRIDDHLPLPSRFGGYVAVLATKAAEGKSSSCVPAVEVLDREPRGGGGWAQVD